MCANPDLHFAIGAMVSACAILGTELLIIAVGGRLCVQLAKWMVREMRKAWEGK
jgi:hypothetical protein